MKEPTSPTVPVPAGEPRPRRWGSTTGPCAIPIRAARLQEIAPAPARTLSQAEAEIDRLHAELARVTEQRDILKKSLGILSHT